MLFSAFGAVTILVDFFTAPQDEGGSMPASVSRTHRCSSSSLSGDEATPRDARLAPPMGNILVLPMGGASRASRGVASSPDKLDELQRCVLETLAGIDPPSS